MNSVIATTRSAVYLAVKHIFPDVPINAGTFEPLTVLRPENTFLDARYPRPVSGCAAEVSQRIAEAVFLALVQAIPDRVTAAPAGTSGNFALGGFDPAKGAGYVMYQITGGGYGGNADHDGLSNGCSTIGISKTAPVEVMEQYYPVLFRRFALREGSGGAGEHRGGFGVHYEVELLRGEARASFVMDHGRFGPPGVLGGRDGAPNVVRIHRGGESLRPAAPLQGPGHSDPRRRPRRDHDAGRRRLRRSRAPRPGADPPRPAARLLHAGAGRSPMGTERLMRYFRPATLAEALAIRRGEDVAIIAGGTDIYPAYATRRAWGDPVHKDVLDISRLAELRGIEDRGDHIRIGALATWTDLVRADLPPLFDGMKDAARQVGGLQVQNRGTVVGNACTASPAGDGIPNLLALDAVFEIAGPSSPARCRRPTSSPAIARPPADRGTS